MIPEVSSNKSMNTLNCHLQKYGINVKVSKYFNAGVFILKCDLVDPKMFSDLVEAIDYDFNLND